MPKRLDADELRWLGEEADGKRGQPYAVVWTRKGRLGLVPLGDPAAKNPLLEVETEYEGEGMRGGAEIVIKYKGKEHPVGDADCIFWTQSAFAKFVIPYYTRFKSPAEVQAMKNKYFQKGNIAVLHFPPSEDEGFPPHGLPKNVKTLEADAATGELKVLDPE